jgi:hypothetical protein
MRAVHELTALIESKGWAELSRFVFGEDGAIDWTTRAFSKRWSMRRLGRAGLSELIAEHVAHRTECFSITPGEEPVRTTVGGALRALPRGTLDAHRWLVSTQGRWIMELSAGRTFTFDFVDERDTKMLKRLRAVDWSRGPDKPFG